MTINDLYWHDSALLNILISRKEDRSIDSIEFEVDWVDIGIRTIVFEDVYWSRLEMCMGQVGKESFASANILGADDADWVDFRSRYTNNSNLPQLCCYLLTTHNGSKIKIIARDICFAD